MVPLKVKTIFPIWSCLLYLCVYCAKKRVVYTGYEAHRFTPANHDDVKILKNLEKENRGLIFLRQTGDVGQPVDIMFAPHLTDYLDLLQDKMESKLLSHDIETQLDHENNVRTLEALGDDEFLFTTYWDHAKLRSFYQDCESKNPEMVKVERYGTSSGPAELPLEAVVVSSKQPYEDKPTMFVDGGTHAREWITVMSCAHFLKEVLDNKQKYASILKIFNFIFVCSVNPEGFQHSWDVNRFWRKTRTPTSMFACPGVDPNRNYPFGFGGGGTSSDQCSDIYRGEAPFSISETKNLSHYAKSKNTRTYTSLHSYSELVLLCYGCRSGKVANQIYPTFESDKAMATAAIEALKNVHGTPYKTDNSDKILYEACGTSQDWFLAHLADYAWTYELRDTGDFGFALPANQIKSCCEETTASLRVLHQLMADEIVDRKMARKDNGKITEDE